MYIQPHIGSFFLKTFFIPIGIAGISIVTFFYKFLYHSVVLQSITIPFFFLIGSSDLQYHRASTFLLFCLQNVLRTVGRTLLNTIFRYKYSTGITIYNERPDTCSWKEKGPVYSCYDVRCNCNSLI